MGVAAPAPQKLTQGPPAVQDGGAAPAHKNVDQMERGRLAVQPPDAENYRPLPIPSPGLERHNPNVPVLAVSYDVATGREVLSPAGAKAALNKASAVVDGSGGPNTHSETNLVRGENFSGLAKVGAYTSYPYRVNCKVFMTFPDNSSWVGSATLVDPCHAITVGHVVHNKSRGGWAKSLYVVPAYNGDAGAIREPYGRAYASQLHSWTSWTNSKDLSKDVGFIDLGRPVGGITGWYGYGYNTNCSWFTTYTWYHNGYPSASPHNGRRMYNNTGDFDSCPGLFGSDDEARFNRKSFGGESGSGHYKFKNGNRYVYAMLSHGNNSYTDSCRLTKSKFDNVGTWISQDRPARYDTTPLYTRGPSSVGRGQRLNGLSFLLHNHSKQRVIKNFKFDVYLSTNNFISTGDRKLGSWNITRTLNPSASSKVWWNVGSHPRVPHTVAEGTYYVGVIMTTADGNGKKKSTSKYDVHKVVVSQLRPGLKQPASNTRNNVTKGYFYITGDNLGNVSHVDFGTSIISSQSSANWAFGYFRKVGNTAIRLYPPQGRKPGNYAVRVLSSGYSGHSNSVLVKLVRNTTRYLAGPGTTKVGATTRLYASGGTGISTNTLIQLTFSWSTAPTFAPGLLSLSIGDNWRQLYFGSIRKISSSTWATSWALGTKPAGYAVLKGRRVYFQCIQADLGNPATLFPLKSTNETSVLYN